MKHFLNIFFNEEIAIWQSYDRKARVAFIYFCVSLIAFAFTLVTGALLLIAIAFLNLFFALNIATIYIPNFYEDK